MRPIFVGILGALVVLAIGGLILHLSDTRKASAQHRPKRSTHAPSHRPSYGLFNLGIAYGMTPNEVRRRLGAPTEKRAGCWVYRGKDGKIRGHWSDPYSPRYSGPYTDAVEFCFSEGPTGGQAVGRIFTHMPAHTIRRWDAATQTVVKKYYPAQWGPILEFVKPPDWYLRQNS